MQKLYRSETDKLIFGVCGGFGEYFEVDPVLVRLVFILFALLDGAGIFLYLLLAFIIPKNPVGQAEGSREDKIKDFAHKAGEKVSDLAQELGQGAKATLGERRERRSSFFGIILVMLGLIFLANIFIPTYGMGNRVFWPLVFIALGLYLIVRRSHGGMTAHHHHQHTAHKAEDKKEETI